MPRNECSFSFNIHRITAISASIHMANIAPLPACLWVRLRLLRASCQSQFSYMSLPIIYMQTLDLFGSVYKRIGISAVGKISFGFL